MSIGQKLISFLSIKAAIKNALILKGADMTDVPFSEYDTKILSLPTGSGGCTITDGWSSQPPVVQSLTFDIIDHYTPTNPLENVCVFILEFNEDDNNVPVGFTGSGFTVDWGDPLRTSQTNDFGEVYHVFTNEDISNMTRIFSNGVYKRQLEVRVNIVDEGAMLGITNVPTMWFNNGYYAHRYVWIFSNKLNYFSFSSKDRSLLKCVVDTPNLLDYGNVFLSNASLREVEIKSLDGCYGSLRNMFSGCVNLEKVTLPTTLPDGIFITDISGMFINCKKLKVIPFIPNTKVNSINSFANGCKLLTYVPIIDVSTCQDFGNVFYDCQSLEYPPPWDYSSAVNFSYTFYGCTKLKNLTNKIVAPNLLYANYTFAYCPTLTSIPFDVSTLSRVEVMDSVFYNTDIRDVGNLDCPNLVNCSNAFSGCKNLNGLSITLHKPCNVISTFYECYSLDVFPFINTEYIQYMDYAFYKTSLRSLDKDFSGCYSAVETFSYCQYLENLKLRNTAVLQNCDGIINSCPTIYTLEIENCGNIQNPSSNGPLGWRTGPLKNLKLTGWTKSLNLNNVPMDATDINELISSFGQGNYTWLSFNTSKVNDPGSGIGEGINLTAAYAKGYSVYY